MFSYYLLWTFTLVLVLSSVESRYSPVDCGNNRVWAVTYKDIDELNVKFHKWIIAYQNLCEGRTTIPKTSFALDNGGIGCEINSAASDLVRAVEQQVIFRPMSGDGVVDDYLWADHDKTKCSLPMRSIDCFTQPLSYCSYDDEHFSAEQIAEMRKDLFALPIFAVGIDTCKIGLLLRKPLQWVLSHFVNYFQRYENIIQSEIDSKVALVFDESFNLTQSVNGNIKSNSKSNSENDQKYTTIGVHIRGGLPDGGRAPINVSVYMKYVDQIAHTMKQQNKPVKLVFMCSHTQELNIIDAKHMAVTYPRPFRYSVLPHLSTGAGESEYAVRDNVLNNRDIVVEFYTDLEILAKVDYFIGTRSNIYNVVAALRIARGQHKHNNQTCFVDTTHQQGHIPPLICEGDDKARQIWKGDTNGFNAMVDASNWYNPDEVEGVIRDDDGD